MTLPGQLFHSCWTIVWFESKMDDSDLDWKRCCCHWAGIIWVECLKKWLAFAAGSTQKAMR